MGSTLEKELRDALTAFMNAASKREGDITTLLQRINDLQQKLGADANPMLRHYLERRSYQKALDLLNDGRPETEKPQCEH